MWVGMGGRGELCCLSVYQYNSLQHWSVLEADARADLYMHFCARFALTSHL